MCLEFPLLEAIHHRFIFSCFLEYALIQKNTQCAGKRKHMGAKDSVRLCAMACMGISELFTYKAESYESYRSCYCELSTEDYNCKHYEKYELYSDLYSLKQVGM